MKSGWGVVRAGKLVATAVIVACFPLLASPVSAAAKPVYFPSRCTNHAFEPLSIVITCADGKTRFETSSWLRWDDSSAFAKGVFVRPDCDILVGCRHYVEDKANVTLSSPIRCGNHRQFSHLLLEDLDMPTPATRQYRATFPC